MNWIKSGPYDVKSFVVFLCAIIVGFPSHITHNVTYAVGTDVLFCSQKVEQRMGPLSSDGVTYSTQW